MPPLRLTKVLLATIAGLLLALTAAAPAGAVTTAEKAAVLYSWTQASSSSYSAWNAARLNQAAWSAYGFDWTTDYCTTSPDQPLGFDFRLPCWRHDFGYRNYTAIGAFSANKSRVDSALYYDLKAKCATYNVFVRPACNSLAWTYYEAVVTLGSVSARDISTASKLKEQGLRAQARAQSALT
jgi:hypothetical protein